MGPGTMAQAKSIIEDAIVKGDSAVFELAQNESLMDMVNRALNFETRWPKTPGDDSNSSGEVALHGISSGSPGTGSF